MISLIQKKVLEMGVDGIIFPMVRSTEQANQLIASTLYPPYGNRGFGPKNAIEYGFKDIDQYIVNTCENLCRFIQIEHIDAVNHLNEIMENPYIDGYIFGPFDLSGSVSQLGNVFGDDVILLMQKCIELLHANGKYVGLSTGGTSEKELKFWHNLGIDMLSAGADTGFLQQRALENRVLLERIHKKEENVESFT